MTLKELIEALEKASEPDRHLDIRIHAEIINGRERNDTFKWRTRYFPEGSEQVVEWSVDKDAIEIVTNWPRYTASVDAALTLWSEPGRYWAKGVNTFYAIMPGGKMIWRSAAWSSDESFIPHLAHGDHKERAISVCLASLKARDTQA